MFCPVCKKRMRPLVKRDKMGRIVKTKDGVRYCKKCKRMAFEEKAFQKMTEEASSDATTQES